MAYQAKFGSKARDYLYSRERNYSQLNGLGDFPVCPHCSLPVTPDQAWDEVHVDVPRAFGGKSTAVGHRRCNQLDNNQVVTPAVAKAEEVRKKFVGIKGPGLGRHPMRGGRRSLERRTMRGQVVPRKSLAQQHRELMALRQFIQVEDIDGELEV
nr:hypothetical protein [uncultured Bradyrhizobium sp.]